MQQRRPRVNAVVAKAVVIEVVPHLNRIGVDARVDLVVAQNRDAEGIVDIGPDVEVRGVVAAQIDRIEEVPAAVRGADQQVRGVLRSILGALLPLVGNRGNGALQVREQVAGTRGRRSRERCLGAVPARSADGAACGSKSDAVRGSEISCTERSSILGSLTLIS